MSQLKNNMEYVYLTEAIELHKKFVEPYQGEPGHCWDSEINKLEKDFGFELPLAYKEYLKFMGKDCDGIFQGSDCFINDVVENTKYLPDLLTENEIDFILPQNYLAFLSHQGYVMAWFELPKLGDDPPVWLFQESVEQEPPKIIGTFSQWFLDVMKQYAPY
jgi:hypothetical protein